MLTDEQIDVLSEALMPYFDELEQWVIQDVARRLGKIRREVMKLLGADKNLKKLIAEQTAEYKREYAKMMEKINREAAKTGADMGFCRLSTDLILYRWRIYMSRPESWYVLMSW